jgi:hypothetical protein
MGIQKLTVILSREDDEGSQNATTGASWLRSSPPGFFAVCAAQNDGGEEVNS